MKKYILLLLLIIILAQSSCSANKIAFPRTDLIYQAIEYGEPSSKVVGFINANGTQHTLLAFDHRVAQPTYSNELNGIFFHAGFNPVEIAPELTSGKLFFLSASGKRKVCEQFVTWFVIPISGNKVMINHVSSSKSTSIEIIDMDTCKAVKTIASTTDVFIHSMSVSLKENKVIYDVRDPGLPYTGSLDLGTIYIFDMKTGETLDVLHEGANPSISPGGEQIAYVADGGIYVAYIDGSEPQLKVPFSLLAYSYRPSLMPVPIWSPDGYFLIYHKCLNNQCYHLADFSIFKYDLKTGVEEKIVDNGLFPIWIR